MVMEKNILTIFWKSIISLTKNESKMAIMLRCYLLKRLFINILILILQLKFKLSSKTVFYIDTKNVS